MEGRCGYALVRSGNIPRELLIPLALELGCFGLPMAQAESGSIMQVRAGENGRVFLICLPIIGLTPELKFLLRRALASHPLQSLLTLNQKKAPETGAGRRRESVMFRQLSHG